MSAEVGIVVTVFRGGCQVVHDGQLHDLRLVGAHAQKEVQLAVGDEVGFDRDRGIVLDVAERRTELSRLPPQGGRRRPDPSHRKIIAANMDRLAIVAAVTDPPFRSGLVDRFLIAAAAGGLEALLVVNKLDLLGDAELPDEIRVYETVLPVVAVSATAGTGLDALRGQLAGSRTVFAGHSGVGKSSLLNALEPRLRLDTGEVANKTGKGRHTTTHALYIELEGGAIAVDTPGIRELATGPVDSDVLARAYPDLFEAATSCRFNDCRHDAEPDCGVRRAIETGALSPLRLASYRKLLEELA